jgi:hypothetical protein
MWDILSRSRTTVHTLSFPFSVTAKETYLRLYAMRFPHLRSLTLGVWGFHRWQVPSGTDNFTNFVLAHDDMLEELDMEYGQDFLYALEFDDSSLGLLREDSLPHLRSFRGCASTLTVMIQARMKCLRTTLHKLIVGPSGRHDETSEMKHMFDAVQAFRTSGDSGSPSFFSALREIELDIWLWRNGEQMPAIECIQKCATCCGSSLEIMTLMVPYMKITAELLGELFGHFVKLRVIRLDEKTFVGRKMVGPKAAEPCPGTDEYKHNNGVIESYVRSIASNCWALEEIFIRHDGLPCQDEWWSVIRCQNPTLLGRRAVCDVRRHVVDKY